MERRNAPTPIPSFGPYWPAPQGVPDGASIGTRCPKISIVTPSLNQGQFLEETILSVIHQGYPDLEFIIIDGGSTDNSVEVIKKYEPWITYWESEADRGQAHAINKGFAKATGEWLAWINSDDYFLPGALFALAAATNSHPDAEWIVGTTVVVDQSHHELEQLVPRSSGGPWHDYVCIRQSGTDLPQPSSFWSRAAWLRAGPLDESFRYVMDHEYWGRLARCGCRPLCLSRELAAFRVQARSKTSEGVLHFWREEIKVVDKWIDSASPEERKSLAQCRSSLRRGVLKLQLREFLRGMRRRVGNAVRSQLCAAIEPLLPKFERQALRKVYWNLRAQGIHDNWGEGTDDFPVLRDVIDAVKPNSILDLGCGSGRCFPLYKKLSIPNVVGQDVSANALDICRRRFPEYAGSLLDQDIADLPHGDDFFDLIISTRVLAAIPPEHIGRTLDRLCRLGRYLYLNEMTDSDYCGPAPHWFKHDYDALLLRRNFRVERKGTITVVEHGLAHVQTWTLFKKGLV